MASLRDSVKDYQEELRDGIAWVAFWKEGRSWNAELFHLEVDGTLEPFDRSRLEEIKTTDPAAVILNGYYCGHLGEDMSLDELTAGVRYHYENSMNDLDGFIGAHDDRLPPEVIKEARAAAHAAGLPFSEKPYRDGEDFDPYVFDGSMSIEDYELMHRMIEKERSEQMDEWKTGYSSYDRDRLDAADKMKIERGIYFETKDADISPLTVLPLAELVKLREESAAAEQTVFENLKVQASAWEEQAGKTLLFDKAIEYARIKEMQDYGYSWDGMFPLKQEAAERLFTQDGIEVFRIYEDGTEGAVTSLTDLQEHAEKGGLFGVEKETWEALHEYNAMKQQLRESKPTKEALLLYGKEDSYGIYQLARGDATRDLRFEPYDRLQATGHTVDRANYELIYTAPLEHGTSLEDIYTRFNIDHPKDFKGHSLSISDIVVLHQNGENTAHYVDRIGFQNVPEFLQEKQAQLIPDEHLTGEQIRTPRGSFYVSDMSVEQMKEAGYGLHHQSDDGKYLIMGNGTRAFAVAAEQPEKTNPLKHIEDTIEQNDNNFDGIINNTPQTPTVDALEQKAKAGEVISLVDLAEAIKTDRENGRGKKAAAKEKPSIRAQLKADKEQAGKKKPTKQKSQDLERS